MLTEKNEATASKKSKSETASELSENGIALILAKMEEQRAQIRADLEAQSVQSTAALLSHRQELGGRLSGIEQSQADFAARLASLEGEKRASVAADIVANTYGTTALLTLQERLGKARTVEEAREALWAATETGVENLRKGGTLTGDQDPVFHLDRTKLYLGAFAGMVVSAGAGYAATRFINGRRNVHSVTEQLALPAGVRHYSITGDVSQPDYMH